MTIVLEAARVTSDEESAYYVKTPDGEVKRHARASTYTGVLDDDYLLRKREDRMLAHGIGKRKDLAALARSHDPDVDKKIYDTQIVPTARAAAEHDAKANHGTSFHKDTELLDQGAAPAALEPSLNRHYHAYLDTLAALPFRILHHHTEQVVILDGHKIAGTIDRVVEVLRPITVTFANGRKIHLEAGDLIILDLKSGRWGPEYNALKWAVQLAIYAHHTATWTADPGSPDEPELGARGPRVNVRADIAIVFHLQASHPEALCDLHWVDLEAGYDAFLTAVEVRGHRAASKKITAAYTDHLPTAFETAAEQWVRDRLNALTPDAKVALKLRWPLRNAAGQPQKYEAPTAEQTEALIAVLDVIEAEHQIPFGPPRPGAATPTKNTRQNRK